MVQAFDHNLFLFFFFNDTATTEIYTLSLHDALPISAWLDGYTVRWPVRVLGEPSAQTTQSVLVSIPNGGWHALRSEEHTSELQSLTNLVCRLLLGKKKQQFRHPLSWPARARGLPSGS